MLWSSRGLKRKVEQISPIFFSRVFFGIGKSISESSSFFSEDSFWGEPPSAVQKIRIARVAPFHTFAPELTKMTLEKKRISERIFNLFYERRFWGHVSHSLRSDGETSWYFEKKMEEKKVVSISNFSFREKKLRFFSGLRFCIFCHPIFFLLDHISRKMSLLVKVISPAPPQRYVFRISSSASEPGVEWPKLWFTDCWNRSSLSPRSRVSHFGISGKGVKYYVHINFPSANGKKGRVD